MRLPSRRAAGLGRRVLGAGARVEPGSASRGGAGRGALVRGALSAAPPSIGGRPGAPSARGGGAGEARLERTARLSRPRIAGAGRSLLRLFGLLGRFSSSRPRSGVRGSLVPPMHPRPGPGLVRWFEVSLGKGGSAEADRRRR